MQQLSESHVSSTAITYPSLCLPSLRSIRILELHPALEDAAELLGQLSIVDLNSPGLYEAVSYVWGRPADGIHISCNGAELAITPNLAAALRQFRHHREVRRLWIDSICINQHDQTEKAQQIAIMGDIYSTADRVLIWLGEESEDSFLACDYMDYLVERIWPRLEIMHAWKTKHSAQLGDNYELHEIFAVGDPNTAESKALCELFGRPWFNRAWTFQESYLAKRRDFYCGSRYFKSVDMTRAWLTLYQLIQLTGDVRHLPLHRKNISMMLEGRNFTFTRTLTMREILYFRRGVGCQYPSDLLYSLLGSASDTEGLIPDYEKSFEDVFTEFALHNIRTTQSLSILRDVDARIINSSSLPSWVPDWRSMDLRRPITESEKRIYSAGGSCPVNLEQTDESNELLLRGFVLDTIVCLETSAHDSCDSLGLNPNKIYPYTGETIKDAKLRARSADRTFLPNDTSLERYQPGWQEQIEMLRKSDSQAYKQFQSSVFGFNAGAGRLALTQGGCICSATVLAREGDLVCVIIGNEVPLILRPRSDGTFAFVGECYAHGFMDGEALVRRTRSENHDHDSTDSAWLDTLAADSLPFSTELFRIR